MKKQLIISMFLALILVGFVACKKDKEITCNLSTDKSQPTVGMSVKYTATQTGDGTIASLSYLTDQGTVTVTNPSLPWTIAVFVSAGNDVSITASGTVKNGSLNITYEGTSGGSSIWGSNSCEQQTK